MKTGQTLARAARDMNELRFQEDGEPPKHTAKTFRERVAEARKDKKERRKEAAKKSKNALVSKKRRLTELGLANKTPLEGVTLSTTEDRVEAVTVDDSENFLDSILEFLDLEFSTNELNLFPVGGVT